MEEINDEMPDNGASAQIQQSAQLLRAEGFGADVPEQEEEVMSCEINECHNTNHATTRCT